MLRLVGSMLLACVCALGAPRALTAQISIDSVTLQPVAPAGPNAVHWTFDEGFGQQTIFVRNTSRDRAITIATWRVYHCVNVRRRICRKHSSGPTIKPGQTVRLGTVHREAAERAFSFRYELTPVWVSDALAPAGQPADSTRTPKA